LFIIFIIKSKKSEMQDKFNALKNSILGRLECFFIKDQDVHNHFNWKVGEQ